MIAIVDYGLGNIRALTNVYTQLNIPFKLAKNTDDFKTADRFILPGVGAFDYAMDRLNKSGMRQTLEEIVVDQHKPILGICVGMQMLARSSEEGILPGLGWIDGNVNKFDPLTLAQSTRLPHMGWNDVIPVTINSLFQGIEKDARFYFLHSYYFCCNKSENILAVAGYGIEFACAVNSGNIFGVQFHPEKSHQWGIQLLKNFAFVK
jgi:glutamine amidotransferase